MERSTQDEKIQQTIDSASAGHWPDIAEIWKQVGPPLRPSQQDITFLKDAVNFWMPAHAPPRVLILGVTPELYHLPWPIGTDIVAVDHTQAMINHIWPGPPNTAQCGSWADISLPDHSRDIVLCDGGIHLLAYGDGHQRLAQMLHRVIAPGGLCIFRLFIPPEEQEEPVNVLQDLLNGKIPNLNLLKLRLGMAMQRDVAQGVELRDVWNALHKAAPDFSRLAAQISWPLEHLLVINTYRDCPAKYHFLGLEEVCGIFCNGAKRFQCKEVCVPTYELGERCPTVVFKSGR